MLAPAMEPPQFPNVDRQLDTDWETEDIFSPDFTNEEKELTDFYLCHLNMQVDISLPNPIPI